MPPHRRIQLLPDKKFWAAYLPLCATVKDASEKLRKTVYGELNRLDNILRPELEARWGKTDAYYEVCDDWNVCRHHSMTVCSDLICSDELLDTCSDRWL